MSEMRPARAHPVTSASGAEELTTKEAVDLGLLKPSQVRKQDPDNPAVRKYFMHGRSASIGPRRA